MLPLLSTRVLLNAEEQFKNWYKNLIITGSDEDSKVYNKLLNDFLNSKKEI